ncbi:MFS transporter [Alkalimarinus sediminis]|uniref:MFS transporter n=1 Tax=Alkalimarinus sediminis TaxID=1632866 RepID=A0A9E8HL40_9ALTE|nr:MFS transporter [Alkalimarinus sediminis]UZW74836.1 MFS transporter [Alkalimarinus sediminis]
MSSPSKIASLVYVIALTQFAMPFMFSGVGITLPLMGVELHASAVALGLVETGYLGAAAAFLLPVGRLADATDKKMLFKVGLLGYGLLTLSIGFASSPAIIIALRVTQGIFGAMVMATGMALITEVVAKEQLGKAMGLSIGAIYAGLAAGPFIGGVITSSFGWRWVYFLTALVLLLSFLLTHLLMKSQWKRPQIKFDWLGSLVVVGIILCLIAGSSILDESHWGGILLVIGLINIPLFFWIEKRVEQPLLRFDRLRANKVLSHALLTQLMMYSGSFGMTFLYSLYLQEVKALSAQQAGQLLVIGPILMAISAPLFGRLADRITPTKITLAGISSTTISLIMATQVDANTSLIYICVTIILQGLGFAMFSSPNMTLIMSSVTAEHYSMASALASKTRYLGMVISMIIITLLMSTLIGEGTIRGSLEGYLAVMQFSFITFSALLLVGVILMLKPPARSG